MPQKNNTCIKVEVWIDSTEGVTQNTKDLLSAIHDAFGDRAQVKKLKADTILRIPIRLERPPQ